MKNKLLKIARYLSQNGLYAEAAQVKSVWESDPADPKSPVEPTAGHLTLSDVIPSDPPKSPEQMLIDLLHAAALVRRKYEGKSLDEIMADLGFSHDSEDYEKIKMELKNLMKNPFYG